MNIFKFFLPVFLIFFSFKAFSESLTLAARHALLQMIDYIVDEYGLSREQAYILCSVAADLRVGQVVDVPNYIVTAVLNLDVFDKNRN